MNTLINATVASSFSSDHSEQVWLNLNLDKENILIACIYRPPSSNAVAFMELVKNITKA